MNRRRFLQTAGATVAAPAVIPSSVLGSMGRLAANDRITMGIIGCGGMGGANMRGFLGKGEVQVVAVCDPDRSRRLAARDQVEKRYAEAARDGTFRGCEAYNDYRELLARDDIDTVVMATPDHWHAPIVVDAARAGKDVYGEKPLSLTVRQGRAMSDAVRRYGRVFQTGSQQRSNNRFRFACELVRNRRIGEVKKVTVGLPSGHTTTNHPTIPVPDGFDYDLWLGPAPWKPYCERRTHWDFRWIFDYSGGQVTDWGAHHIDIAHWGLGLTDTGPVHVSGSGSFPQDGLFDTATDYRFVCRYRNGVELTATNDVENGVLFEGDEGTVFVNRGRIATSPESLLSTEIRPNETRLYKSSDHRQDFVDCVRSRREPIAPIEQAHRTITVAHLGNIAMLLGRPIRWDPDTETIDGDEQASRMLDRAMREPWQL